MPRKTAAARRSAKRPRALFRSPNARSLRGMRVFQGVPPVQDVQRCNLESLSRRATNLRRTGAARLMAGREHHCASAGTQKSIDVLIPTCNRAGALAVTLTSLCSQSFRDFDVIVSDQSENYDTAVLAQTRAVVRVLERHGSRVTFHKNLPKCGPAQQR